MPYTRAWFPDMQINKTSSFKGPVHSPAPSLGPIPSKAGDAPIPSQAGEGPSPSNAGAGPSPSRAGAAAILQNRQLYW